MDYCGVDGVLHGGDAMFIWVLFLIQLWLGGFANVADIPRCW
jgi:hypothetical protein